MTRPNWDEYFLKIALDVSSRSTCLRRKYGAIIVKDNIILSTGYNGSERGAPNCIDLKFCERERLNIKPGERYELCRSVHAECNAIISCDPSKMKGAVMYLAGTDAKTGEVITANPCMMCKRLLVNSGITTVYMTHENLNLDMPIVVEVHTLISS